MGKKRNNILNINKKITIAIIIIVFIEAIFSLYIVIMEQRLIDIYFPSLNISYILQGILIFGIFYCLEIGSYFVCEYLARFLHSKYELKLKKAIRDKYYKLNYYDLDKVDSSKLITLMNNDTDCMAKKYSLVIKTIFSALFKIVTTIFMMFYYSWEITICLLLILFVYIFINKKLNNKIDNYTNLEKKTREDLNRSNKLIMDNFVFYKMQENNDVYIEMEDNYFNDYKSKSFSLRNMRVLLIQINLIITLLITVFIYLAGGYYMVNGDLTLGKVIGIGLLCQSLAYPIGSLANGFGEKAKDNVSEKRIKDFMHIDEEKINDTDVDAINSIFLDNVSFSYDKDKYILNDFSYLFNKSNFYIIKGESGKGKSTIIKLILSFLIPKNGNIKINNNNLDDINIEKYRKKVGYLSQNTELLSGISIKDNVILEDNYDIDKFNKYQKIFEIDKWIDSIPNKWDTIVSENLNVSGGQKQRLAIIKTLCSKKDVYILDEPENGLSDQLIDKLYRVCVENAKESIVIMISHHSDFSKYNAKIVDLNNS